MMLVLLYADSRQNTARLALCRLESSGLLVLLFADWRYRFPVLACAVAFEVMEGNLSKVILVGNPV